MILRVWKLRPVEMLRPYHSHCKGVALAFFLWLRMICLRNVLYTEERSKQSTSELTGIDGHDTLDGKQAGGLSQTGRTAKPGPYLNTSQNRPVDQSFAALAAPALAEVLCRKAGFGHVDFYSGT